MEKEEAKEDEKLKEQKKSKQQTKSAFQLTHPNVYIYLLVLKSLMLKCLLLRKFNSHSVDLFRQLVMLECRFESSYLNYSNICMLST